MKKVGIVIITYNIQTDVFLLQIEAIKKFCKDDYKIEIFDNSTEDQCTDAIKYHCEQLGLSLRKTRSHLPKGSLSHAYVANLSFNILKDSYGYLFYLDHDCIPVKEFSVVDILGDKIIGGLAQKDPTYFWQGCLMFNNNIVDRTLINFLPNEELKLDTGGEMYKVVEKYGKENCVFFNEVYEQNHLFSGKFYNFYSMLCNEIFMHFINASNWNDFPNHEERVNSLVSVAREKISKI